MFRNFENLDNLARSLNYHTYITTTTSNGIHYLLGYVKCLNIWELIKYEKIDTKIQGINNRKIYKFRKDNCCDVEQSKSFKDFEYVFHL